MLRPYQILAPLLSLFLVRVDLTDLWPLTYEVSLLRLIDADTAEVKLGAQKLRIRLSKLDAPEKGQPFYNGQGNAGLFALACAQKVVDKRRKFSLVIYKKDIYGRYLGDLDSLSYQLVKAGCSGLYPHAEFRNQKEKWVFLQALDLSKRQGLGLWARGGYLRPQLWRKRHRFSKRTSHRLSHQ
jgi:endonuclease YncB( thermonuclease family)